MTRQLTAQQAFQTQCLSQMGVSSWLSSEHEVEGVAYFSSQPWPMLDAFEIQPPKQVLDAFAPVTATTQKLAPEEKDQTVANLREQLNTGPEIIVEDLQPIEELAVDIEVEAPAVDTGQRRAALDIRCYNLSNKLLLITDLPQAFSDLDGVDKLAVNMAQALLKSSIDEWQTRQLNWPGKLVNPHFLYRQDWLLGALEGQIEAMLTDFQDPLNIIIAGENIASFLREHSVKRVNSANVAYIASLPELYRIPELRKEAWQEMQQQLFS
ncbi:hypothetical protein [Marinomonas epiphytica]